MSHKGLGGFFVYWSMKVKMVSGCSQKVFWLPLQLLWSLEKPYRGYEKMKFCKNRFFWHFLGLKCAMSRKSDDFHDISICDKIWTNYRIKTLDTSFESLEPILFEKKFYFSNSLDLVIFEALHHLGLTKMAKNRKFRLDIPKAIIQWKIMKNWFFFIFRKISAISFPKTCQASSYD